MSDNIQRAPAQWSDWLATHKKTLILASICVAVALIGSVWMMQARNARQIRDFETADILAEELQKSPKVFNEAEDPAVADKALLSLKALDDDYAILQPRFDSLIAEEMLLRDKQKEVDPYAKRTVERLRELGLIDFADFSEISRLVGLGQYKDALTTATELKTRLQTKKQGMPTASSHDYLLEAFLLLHIASLNQKLGNHEAKMQTTLELKEHLGLSRRKRPLSMYERELASQVLAHLQDNQHSLLEFIEEMPKGAGS